MTRRFVNQLANGDTIDEVYLVADKQLRANRQGNLYLHLELRDKLGDRRGPALERQRGPRPDVRAGGLPPRPGQDPDLPGGLQVILSTSRVMPLDQVEPEDFLPQTTQNVAKLTARLREVLFGLRNPHLRALGRVLPDRRGVRPAVHHAPAGIKNHHAYQAGLLEHVVNDAQRGRADQRPLPRRRPRPPVDGDLPPRHRQGRRAELRPGLRLHRRGPARRPPGDGRRDAPRQGRADRRPHRRAVPRPSSCSGSST